MSIEYKQQKYREAILQLPTSRGGGQYNANISSVTAHGIHLGYTVEQIKMDLDSNGRGCYKPNEVENAYKAGIKNGFVKWDFDKEYQPSPEISAKMEKVTIKPKYKPFHRAGVMMDLTEESPIRLLDHPSDDCFQLLNVLYHKDDVLFIGDTYDTQVKTVKEWTEITDLNKHPFIIPNPFTGRQGFTSTGKVSFRCEETIKECRFCVIEMDDTPLEEQVCFWLDAIYRLPVACIIHSGSKSLHGWLKIDCPISEWNEKVKKKLFEEMLVPMGADASCSNKARLSRLPGHYRQDKEQQRLLYLREC